MALRIAVPVEQYWHRVPGGTARATRETIRALTRTEGLSVAQVAAWHRPSRRSLGDAGAEDVAYLPLPRPLLYELWITLDRPPIERSVGPVDVVWASSMIPVPTAAPLVATVHDVDFLDHRDRLSRRGRSFFARAWQAVGERATWIVCPSRVVADDCVRHGIHPDRLRVVPWGVSTPLCPADEAAATIRPLGLPRDFVLWVGTIEPRKNLSRLVEAMAQIGGPQLVVVGPDGWQIDGEDVLAPLGDNVHRLGHVDDRTLSALYHSAAAFAFPSLVEGFGLPVLEAMAHGTPVVTSAGTATEEVAGDAAVLVDPTDIAAIAAGIEAALSEDPTTLQRIRRGRQRADHLSWSSTAEGYASVFRDAAGPR